MKEHEVESVHSELADLVCTSAAERAMVLSQLRSTEANLADAQAELVVSTDRLTKEVNELHSLRELDNSKNSELVLKNSEIESLQAHLYSLQSAHNAQCENGAATIERLRSDLVESEQCIASSSAGLRQEIEEMEAVAASKSTQMELRLAEMEQDVACQLALKQAELSEKAQELAASRAEVDQLQQQLLTRQAEIANKRTEVNDMVAQLSVVKADMQTKLAQLEQRMRDGLCAKEEELADKER